LRKNSSNGITGGFSYPRAIDGKEEVSIKHSVGRAIKRITILLRKFFIIFHPAIFLFCNFCGQE